MCVGLITSSRLFDIILPHYKVKALNVKAGVEHETLIQVLLNDKHPDWLEDHSQLYKLRAEVI